MMLIRQPIRMNSEKLIETVLCIEDIEILSLRFYIFKICHQHGGSQMVTMLVTNSYSENMAERLVW